MLSLELLASLADRRAREANRLFTAEGFRFLHGALDARAEIVGLAVCPSLYPDSRAARLVRSLGVPKLELSPEAFRSVTSRLEPQGIVIVAKQRWNRLIDVPAVDNETHLVLDAPRSPGNVGTILRSCQAFGVRSVWIVGGEADPYDPACVRATMGAIFTQNLVRTSAKAMAGWKSRRTCWFVGADAAAPLDIRRPRYRGPIAVVMGNERTGLRPTQRELCDTFVRIPMTPGTDSLNLSVATSLALFEIWRSRNSSIK